MDTDESKEGVRKYVFAKLRNGLALAVPFSDYKELEEAIERLSRSARGSFIYASLSIRATLRSASWNRKLRELLDGSRPDGLDGFYITALCSPLAWNRGGGCEASAKVMGLVVCGKKNQLSLTPWMTFLGSFREHHSKSFQTHGHSYRARPDLFASCMTRFLPS